MADEFFIDTALFFCYAHTFEDDNVKCSNFFSSNKDIVISKNVRNELDIRIRRRKEWYMQIAKHLSYGMELRHFKLDGHVNENDNSHIESLLYELTKESSRPDKQLTSLRNFIQFINTRISEAKGKIKYEAACCDDFTLQDFIFKCISNQWDAKIIVDAVYWSEKTSSNPIFLTLDKKHIILKRKDIYGIIGSFRPTPHPLKINHIEEIAI